MEHTNLFLFEDESAMAMEYPDGKIESPIPGVSYARDDDRDDPLVYFNDKITNYSVTVTPQDRSGVTIDESYVVTSPQVLEGNTVKVRIPPCPIDGYKEINNGAKIEISGSVEYTSIYLVETSYTITVNHMFSGESIASATTIIVEDVFEDDVVSVLIEPLEIEGYSASPVTIQVSGDTTYDIEYSEVTTIPYVDMGFPSGTLWAEYNVGATSMEEFGDFFAYGDINSRTSFTRSDYAWYDTNSGSYTKYGDVDNKYRIDPADDAATVYMGGEWHTPSLAQYNELLENATVTTETINGIPGTLFTSNINGNTLFFPLGGESSWDDGPVSWSGECGGYQTSKYASYGEVRYFELGSGESPSLDSCPQYAGNMCRGVIGIYDPEPS